MTRAVGAELAAMPGLVAAGADRTFRGPATTYTVLAETRSGNDGNVVMAGAHLDSVNAGPGINDNGSGSAAMLEVAEQMARVEPRNKRALRLWGAEESGLVGSTHYVNKLTAEKRSRSRSTSTSTWSARRTPCTSSTTATTPTRVGRRRGPGGSAQIEKTFEAFYDRRGLPVKGTDFSGRSDYGPFIAAGIPSGGLFTGAEGIKTAEEAALWGGTAGAAYDPCYHRACDTVEQHRPARWTSTATRWGSASCSTR